MYSDQEKDRIQVALCGLWQTLMPTGRPLPIETQRGYAMAFATEGLTVEEIEKACGLALSRCTFFPKPVELIASVRGSVDARALAAWQNVMQYVDGRVNLVSAIDLADPVANAALRAIGGPRHMAQGTDSEHEKFTRPRFIEAYKAYANVEVPASKGCALPCFGKSPAVVLNGGVPRIERLADHLIQDLSNKLHITRKENEKT